MVEILGRFVPEVNIQQRPILQNSNPKLVLFWSPKYGSLSTDAWGEGKLVEVMEACPFKCQFTVDKSLLSISEAVVYHGWPEGNPMYPLPKPSRRRRDQVWVFFMLEPPCFATDKYEQMNDHYDFNWTFTYRRDSDVLVLYGDFVKSPSDTDPHPVPEYANDSRKILTGMISNCNQPSGRDEYIRELKRFMHVDICGECGGNPPCQFGRRPWTEKGFETLGKKYKFWLSFENSLAPDYLTEKFFLPIQYGMVPVYFGHPDNLRYAPPGSYIHTKDFKSPKALAEYLIRLDKNPSEYLKFFEWRKQYQLITTDMSLTTVAWCGFCTKLHTLAHVERKSYRSVREWILRNNTNSSICWKPWNKDTGFSP